MSTRKAKINGISYNTVGDIIKSLHGAEFCSLDGDTLTILMEDTKENHDFLDNSGYTWTIEEENFPLRINSFDELTSFIKVMWSWAKEGNQNPEYTEDWIEVINRYVEECKNDPSINGTLIRMISGAYYSGNLENGIADIRKKFKTHWEEIGKIDTLTSVTDFLFRRVV